MTQAKSKAEAPKIEGEEGFILNPREHALYLGYRFGRAFGMPPIKLANQLLPHVQMPELISVLEYAAVNKALSMEDHIAAARAFLDG